MDGDQLQAFTELYQRHADAVHRYASRRSDRETAEEVVAQVFAIAWRRRALLPAEPLPWLYGAARRVLADQRRAASRRQKLYERLRNSTALEQSEGLSLPVRSDAVLAQALERISEPDREALLLTYWEELSPAEVAQAMGCSRRTLAVRLHRARIRLRQQLDALSRNTHEQRHDHPCMTGTESI